MTCISCLFTFQTNILGGPAAIRDLETPKYLRIEEDEPETWTQTVRVKIFSTLFCENNNISYIFKLGNGENHKQSKSG